MASMGESFLESYKVGTATGLTVTCVREIVLNTMSDVAVPLADVGRKASALGFVTGAAVGVAYAAATGARNMRTEFGQFRNDLIKFNLEDQAKFAERN